MRNPSFAEALEQWRLIYGQPECRTTSGNETSNQCNTGINAVSEQPQDLSGNERDSIPLSGFTAALKETG